MRRLGVLSCVALVLAGLVSLGAPSARAADAAPKSLPRVESGARPGPDVLYDDPPDVAQLRNRPPFKAEPLLVMGEEAYVGGEYLYQDWIYDDNGADTGTSDAGGTDTAGDVEYPADGDRYGGNAADLVELRIAPRAREVVYRFTLNTLLVPDSTMVTVVFDAGDAVTGLVDPTGQAWPEGADKILTTWGTGASFTDANGPCPGPGRAPCGNVTTDVPVEVDLDANQVTVVVPRATWDPDGTVGALAVVGLRDPATGGYLAVPGGPLDPEPLPFYDLGFTFDEAPAGLTSHDAKQAVALRDGALQWHPIDFDALAARVDRTTVPATGTMSRIFPSRIDFGEGKDYDDSPELHGRLQPYSIYVPTSYVPGSPAPLMLDLHSLGEHHWQYNGSTGVQQIGEQRGAIVITCECRGEDGWYLDEAEYDVFEMWNDVARHYSLDPDRVGITGYSMGGYATYRLATLYPDLFSRALSIVGPPTAGIWLPPDGGDDETLTNHWLDNARNIPFLNAVAVPDELVPYYGTRAQNIGAPQHGIRGFEQLGYRCRFLSYPTAEHLTIGALGYDLPYQAEFLGDTFVDRDPFHVTFRYVPATDNAELGLVHDHAYWVSGTRLRDTDGELPSALVDGFSHAHGKGDPTGETGQAAGNGPLPYVEEYRTWGEPPSIAVENRLALRLENVAEVTIDLARARLSLEGLMLDVETDEPAVVHLVDGDRVEHRHVGGDVVGAVPI